MASYATARLAGKSARKIGAWKLSSEVGVREFHFSQRLDVERL